MLLAPGVVGERSENERLSLSRFLVITQSSLANPLGAYNLETVRTEQFKLTTSSTADCRADQRPVPDNIERRLANRYSQVADSDTHDRRPRRCSGQEAFVNWSKTTGGGTFALFCSGLLI